MIRTSLKKIKNIFNDLLSIETLCIHASRIETLSNRSLFSSDSIIEKSDNNILVSLTTYKNRIHDVHLVIESLSLQTVKPNRVILWLDENEYNLKTIPILLKKQVERGLEIKFCKDYKSYKKLLPSLSMHNEYNIITIDDDIIYPIFFIERFLLESNSFPNVVLCYRAHKLTYNKQGELNKYVNWDYETKDYSVNSLTFPTGVFGVYYPINSLSDFCSDYELAKKLAPSADDIWFKKMSSLNGVDSKVIINAHYFYNDFIEIKRGQDIALNNINVMSGENDKQIRNIEQKFGRYV